MKKNLLSLTLLAGSMAVGAFTLTACPTPPKDPELFSFTLTMESKKTDITVGDTDFIEITTNGAEYYKKDGQFVKIDKFDYEYTCSAVGAGSLEVTEPTDAKKGTGYYIKGITPSSNITFTVKEKTSKKTAKITFNVIDSYAVANGGFNYASASGAQAIQDRTNILASLEKYAMDTHLTGITLFENGGYVKYSPRVVFPTSHPTYITGYGFGILSEGDIDVTKGKIEDDNPNRKAYLHSAMSSDPATINAWNNTGSQVSDLASYITSAYWGTKMSSNFSHYEWYPVLAKDTVGGKAYNRPTPVDKNGKSAFEDGFTKNDANLYKTWRIYVKTGANGGVKYRQISSSGSPTSFDNMQVRLEDYAFALQCLLTGANNMQRGTEMAGDTSYGIKGAQTYYNRTKTLNDQTKIDNTWNEMVTSGKLGVRTGNDSVGGEYIELELVNPIDDFTAMYTLSSNLYSPIPRSFIEHIGGGSVINGVKKYGNFNNGTDNAILDYTLSLGAYTLEEWTKKQTVVFKQNDTWFERTTYPNRYKIKGVKMLVIDASNDEEAIYKQFNTNMIDSCGIPTKKLAVEKGQPGVYPTKGDSTFKLNINSCTQDRWNELFGPAGKISKNSTWDVKPWMSNDNFLKGLFFSINRKQFAENRGVQPSINYFADSYLSDPENGVSYNSTEAHKNAVKDYTVTDANGEDMYGYDFTKATRYFKAAVAELVKEGKITRGTASDPTVIEIHIEWMYQTDTTEYGEDIAKYFEDAFNDPSVSNNTVKLEVTQTAVTQWDNVYNEVMMKGQFDLAFGAISGNSYNPLNFLEVLKSDNSSGFTLNWGPETSTVDDKNALVYDNQKWSFDALWNVADHGGVVENGQVVKPIKNCYMELPRAIGSTTQISQLYNGCDITIPVEFVNVGDTAKYSVEEVRLTCIGGGDDEITGWEYKDGKVNLTISAELAAQINSKIIDINKLADVDPQTEATIHPFVMDNYGEGKYWVIDIYYNVSIKTSTGEWGDPTQNVVTVAKNKDAQQKSAFKFLGK